MEDRQFARLLAFLDYSWNGYRRVRRAVKKRATCHMSELECRNMDQYLERAQKGLYPGGALREVDNARREKWFSRPKKDRYALKPSLKHGIDFRVHDLLADDPHEKELDIVFLRNNLLTYYDEELFEEPLVRIIEALRPGGFLVIGAKEIMPETATECVTRHDGCVYRKTGKKEGAL